MLMALTLLPLPDSPTSATVLVEGMSKLTPFTASTVSVLLMRKDTQRSWTLINVFMVLVPGLAQFWVQRVAQGIGQQRERRDERGHEGGSGHQLPPFAKYQLGLGFCQHGAPADHVNRNPQTQERQNHLGLDEPNNVKAQLHQHHMADVGQDVGEHARLSL